MTASFVPGTLNRSLDHGRITELLRLFGEVGELDGDLSRRRHLVSGLARVLHADDSALVVLEDFVPAARSRIASIVRTGDESDAGIRARFRPYFDVGGVRFDPSLARLSELRSRAGGVTRLRRELLCDRAWYEAGPFSEFMRATRLDDAILSYRELGQHGRAEGLTVRRARGERPFTEEDRNLVHMCVLAMGSLLDPGPDPGGRVLTPRERDTLKLLLAGASEKEAAESLGVSVNTVHVYVKSLYRAFGVRSRAELMTLCLGRRGRPQAL